METRECARKKVAFFCLFVCFFDVSPFPQHGCHTTRPMTLYFIIQTFYMVVAPIMKISYQSDKAVPEKREELNADMYVRTLYVWKYACTCKHMGMIV